MHIRPLSAFFWLLLATATQLGAQPTSQAPTAEENSLLWKISGEQLAQPSFLFGTIHLIPADDYNLAEPVRRSLDAAQQVAFEIDTEVMSNPLAMMPMLMKMMMNNDTTLADLLSAEDYQLVADHFTQLGLPMLMMRRVKPMFLTVLASEDMKNMPASQGNGEVMSYELELTRLAKEAGKKINGLETIEYQMGLFDSIPYRAQAKMLLESVKAESQAEGAAPDLTFERMVEMYKNQDIVGMQTMMGDEQGGLQGYEDLLLLQRNRNWIPVMANLMSQGSVFFAVGAGHLAGEEGVIALLRTAGYTVEPVRE